MKAPQALTPELIKEEVVKYDDSFKKVIPSYMNLERMYQIIESEVTKNSSILRCSQQSILNSVYEACWFGLEPSSITGHGSLVPFGKTCTFLIGYRGILELAHRAGHTIWAHAVYENDPVKEVHYGTNPRIDHTPLLHGDKGALIGAYAVADLGKDRPRKYKYMSIDDLRVHSKYSKNMAMWKQHPEAMALKTVIRMLGKTLSTTPVEIKKYDASHSDRFNMATRVSDDNSGFMVDIDSGEFEYIDHDDTNPDTNPETKGNENDNKPIVKQKPTITKSEKKADSGSKKGDTKPESTKGKEKASV